MDVRDRAVIVAGGAGNLGSAVVAALAERGARVAVMDARVPDNPVVAALSIQVDLAHDEAVAQALEQIVAQCGNIGALVNCAGLIHSESLVNLTNPQQRRHAVDSWERVMRSNLTATFVVSARVAEHMAASRTKGAIVNFSSIAASGNRGQTAYAAAKAGVEAMTNVWARELGPLGIRAVAIAPGFVDTASTQASMPDAALADMKRRTPLMRLGRPEEIASAVLFALENDYVTGTTIAVNGGLAL